MSTIDTSPELITAPAERREETAARGAAGSALAALVTSADHKVIGRLFVGASLLALLAITVLNALLGAERIDGDGTLLDEGSIVQLFAAQRVGMLFGVLVPLLLGVAIAIVPLQLGARALAFPRLAMAGFWTWLAGLVIIIVALANNGGPGGGDGDMVDLFIAAHALLLIGLAAASVSVATSVLTTRAPGMRLGRVPFFSWGALIAAVGLILLVPVIVGTLVYLFVDHRHGRAIFGGNDGIAVWLRFAWTQPTTYLYALPAVGFLAEMVPVTFQRRAVLRGVTYAGIALVGVAALAGITPADVPRRLGRLGRRQARGPRALGVLPPPARPRRRRGVRHRADQRLPGAGRPAAAGGGALRLRRLRRRPAAGRDARRRPDATSPTSTSSRRCSRRAP